VLYYILYNGFCHVSLITNIFGRFPGTFIEKMTVKEFEKSANNFIKNKIFNIMMKKIFNNFKKIDSQNVTTQMDYFERRLYAQTQ